jgi:hypothetical protein
MAGSYRSSVEFFRQPRVCSLIKPFLRVIKKWSVFCVLLGNVGWEFF